MMAPGTTTSTAAANCHDIPVAKSGGAKNDASAKPKPSTPMSSPSANPRCRTGNHSVVDDTTELAMQPPATPCRKRSAIMPS